jgi:PAS domain S-box-containing protein
MVERDLAEVAIRDSETRYRRLFETAQDGILILDADSGQITDVNPFLISMLGYSHKEFLGRKLWEVGAFKDIIESKAKFLELQKKGYVRYENLPLQTKGGKPMAVEFVSNSYRVDHTNVIQCNIRDITDRKRAEERARLIEARYSNVFNNSMNCIAVYKAHNGGEDFTIVDFNKSAERVENVKKKDIIGKRVTSVFPGVRAFGIFDVFRRVWKTGKPEYFPAKVYKDNRIAGWRENYILRLDSGEIVAIYSDLTVEKQAEENLKESEAKYSGLVNSVEIGVFRNTPGPEGHFIEANPAFIRMFEAGSRAELLKHSASELYEDPRQRKKVSDKIVRQGFIRREELRLKTLKGRSFWALSTVVLKKDRAGNQYFDGMVEDITARKNAEDALRESEEKYRTLADSSLQGMVIAAAPPIRLAYANPSLARMLGYSVSELTSMTEKKIFKIIHPDDRDMFFTRFRSRMKGEGVESNYEVRVVRKDGKMKVFEISANAIRYLGKPAVQATFIDITDRKAAQEQLIDIIESLPDATFAVDLKGRVIYWNREMELLSGIKSGGMLGKPSGEVGKHFYGWKRPVAADLLLNPIDSLEKEYDYFERQGDILTAKGWVPRLLRGKLGYVWVMVRPLYDSDGGIVGAIESVRDITSQKRNEDALYKKNRMLALISECNQAIVRSGDENSLMREICRILVDTGGYRMAWAGCAELSGKKRVIPKASYGFDEGYLKTLDITWADTRRGRGPTGTAVRTGRPSIARDIPNSRRFAPWRKDAIAHGYASSIALPIQLEGARCGALNIYAGSPDAFDAEEVRLLDELAQDIAHGISALRSKVALGESEKTFAAIFNNATDIVVFLDSSGMIQKINPSVNRMWGYDPADIVGKRFNELTQLLPPDSISVMAENFRKRVSGIDVSPYVVEARTTEDRQVFVEVRGSAVRKGNVIAGAVVTLSDITKRLSADKRLLASYQVASVLSAGGPMADTWPVVLQKICTNLDWAWGEIWVVDERRKLLTLAESWHEPSKKYLPFEKVSSEIQFKSGSGLVGRVWASGKPVWVQDIVQERVFLRTAAAKKVGFKSACAIPLAMGGEVVGVMVFFSDKERPPEHEHLQSLNLVGYQIGQFIKRKSAERSLQDSENRFRNIFEHGSIGILLSGHDYRFIRANPAACRIFGYTEPELSRLTFKEITHPEHRGRDIEQMGRLGAGKIPFYKTEKRYIRKDGQIIWGAVNVSAIRDSKDNVLYYLAMVDDITEEKQNEDLLRSQKDQLQELSQLRERFMADMTHELKTPLSVIMLNLDMARNMDPLTESADIAKSFDLMWRNTMRLSISVEQIMQLTKLESVDIRSEKFSLDKMMRLVLEDYMPLARSKGLTLDLTGNDIEVEGDPHILSMAVSNLVSNALKFTDRGGVRVVWSEEGADIVISVSDTGVGIKPENKPKVFDKFFKENHSAPGSGIGLAISSTLIKKMGGRIEFETMHGHGSTFRILIPKVAKK